MGLPPCRFTSTFEVARLYAANLHLGQSPVNQKPIKLSFSLITRGAPYAYWRIGNGKKHDRSLFTAVKRFSGDYKLHDAGSTPFRFAQRIRVSIADGL